VEGRLGRATVSAGYAGALTDFAVSKGADREALLARAGISEEDLADQDNRVAMDRYVVLMRTAKELCGEPALALQFSEGTAWEAFSIVGLICRSAGSMGEALGQLNRYRRLIAEVDVRGKAERFQLLRRDGGLWLEDQRPDPNTFPELTESALSRFACEVTRHYGDVPFVKALQVTHPRPAHASEYERIFKAPVTFGAERNAMLIDESWLSLGTTAPNGYVFGVFNSYADALLKRLESEKSVRGKVESVAMAMLHRGEVRREAVAAQLNMSAGALYRRLKAEGVTFEQLLDDLRRDMANGYLDNDQLSVNEAAYLLGYSEPAAFSRAFKRWTGKSPSARKAAQKD